MPESSTGEEAHQSNAAEDLDLHGGTEESGSEGIVDNGVKETPAAAPTEGKKDEKKTGTMLDAIRAALHPDGKEQSSGSGEGEDANSADPNKSAGGEAAEGEEEGEVEELTEEERKALSAKAQRRFKHFVKETKVLTEENARLKPAAEGFASIQAFAKKANLSREDVNTGFNIMDLMKNSPREAYEKITPIYNTLKALVGEVLPKDLHEQVTKGMITLEHAQELSRLRADKGYSTHKAKTETTQAEEQRIADTTAAAETAKTDVMTALTKWENSWKASDPDYSRIHGRVSEAIELEFTRRERAGTLPTNGKDAVKMADDVKKRVTADLRKLLPQKKAITPVIGSGVTNGSKPAPKSMLDVVKQAVGQ